MSFSSTTDRAQYTGNGSTKDFAVPFPFQADGDIAVVVTTSGVDSTKTLNVDYTVTGEGTEGGGNVRFTTAPASGATVTIYRDIDLNQTRDFSYNGSFPTSTVTGAADKAMQAIQQLNAKLKRTFRISEASAEIAPLTVSDRAGKVPAFDNNGNPTLIEPEITALPNGAAYDVANIAALKAITVSGVPASKQVTVAGYYTPGDGGGGVFYYDSGSSATDNGGTIIEPNSGAGRWIRVNECRIDVKAFGAKGDWDGIAGADDTAKIQACLNTALNVSFLSGRFKISDHLTLRSGHDVDFSSSVRIDQTTVNKNIFRAVQKSGISLKFNGATLFGQGAWSNAWTGNQGHEDRGIQFLGCTNCRISSPMVKNCASAGIAIIGGESILIENPFIEGTDNYSTPLSVGDNFQNGIYISNDSTYGGANDIFIVSPDISGTAQGILREEQPAISGSGNHSTIVLCPNIHDIPGQHAFYIQSGSFTVSSPILSNIALSGVKIQSADANKDISGFSATGVSSSNLGGSLFEIACIGSGSLKDAILEGTANSVGYGITINGECENISAQVLARTVSGNGAFIQGAGVRNVTIKLSCEDVSQDGILVTATNASGIDIYPKIFNCNSDLVSGGSGVRVNSASATVNLHSPDIEDTGSNMAYGIFNSVAGSFVNVYGHVRIIGATDTAVRASGIISNWPSSVNLFATNGDFTGITNIRSDQQIFAKLSTNSGTNSPIWGRTLEDESAYLVRAEIVGMLSGSAQRAAYVSTILVYRDGGGATIQGSEDTDFSIASGSFTGVYSWGVSGNDIFLLVNSGGLDTYIWKARVTVTLTTA